MTSLSDPKIELSVAWELLRKQLGKEVEEWEPDTIRLELSRRKIDPASGLMAKILAAQTVLRHSDWATNHDVFFAFALACDGIPADVESLSHPTVEQLCWAIEELSIVLGFRPSEDEGFDPDVVDPAIAVVLHEDGWVLTPRQLRFVQPILDRFTHDPGLTSEVGARWALLSLTPTATLRREADHDETALDVQIARLADARLYVEERLQGRARQLAALSS